MHCLGKDLLIETADLAWTFFTTAAITSRHSAEDLGKSDPDTEQEIRIIDIVSQGERKYKFQKTELQCVCSGKNLP